MTGVEFPQCGHSHLCPTRELINSTPVIPGVNHFPHLTSLTPTTLIIEGTPRLSSFHEGMTGVSHH